MPNILDMLNQAAGTVPAEASPVPLESNPADAFANLADTKKQDLGGIADQKKAAMPNMYNAMAAGRSSSGALTMSQEEEDLRSLTPAQMYEKYGDRADGLLLQRNQARQQVQRDESLTRNNVETTGDLITGVAGGFANAIGGIGALGAGLVSDKAGATIAESLGDLNKYIQGTQSEALNARRRLLQAASANDQRDTTAQAEADEKTVGPTIAGIRRVGRDVVDSLASAAADPVTLSDGVAQGVGSLLAAGPVAKTIASFGSLVPASTRAAVQTAAAIDAAAGTTSVVRGLAQIGKATVPAAIGAMEAGGAYQQTVNEVMETSFEDLQKNSKEFNALISAGTSPEDARLQLANEAGRTAALIQAPLSIAAGTLVSRFEGAPFSVGSLRAAGGNLVRETIEEGVQSGTGQMSQNFAQRIADNNKTLTEGVGEQIGQGALYGLGTAGAIQAPSVVANNALAAVGAAGRTTMGAARLAGDAVGVVTKPFTDFLVQRGDKVIAENEKASPIADTVVAQASQQAVAEAPVAAETMRAGVEAADATPEQKAVANQYIDDLVNVNVFDPVELDRPGIPDTAKSAVAGVTNRVEAIQRIADVVNQTKDSSPEYLASGLVMYDMLMDYENFMSRDPAALDNIPADHPAQEIVNQYSKLAANIQNTPNVSRALRAIVSMVQEATVKPVTEESLATPEGQQNLRVAVGKAEIAPEKANLEINQQILKQESEGKLQLDPIQRAALMTSVTLLQAAKDHTAQVKALGHMKPADIVSDQIQTNEERKGDGTKSAVQHSKEILAAKRAGNDDLARALLSDFGKFVEHMSNKVTALNTHFATGNPNSANVTYPALMPDRSWKESSKGLYVNPFSPKSVENAQAINLEAKTLADIFNGFTDAFPELGIGHIQPVSLNSLLDGPIRTVATEFRSQVRRAVPLPVQPEVAVQPEPAKPAVEKAETPSTTPDQQVEEQPTATTAPTTVEQTSDKPVVLEQPDTDTDTKTESLSSEKQSVSSVEIQDTSNETEVATPFSNLFKSDNGKAKSLFTATFTVPQEAKTRTFGSDAPISVVQDALSSEQKMVAFIGSEPKIMLTPDVVKAYRQYLSDMPTQLVDTLSEQLDTFLNQGKEGNTVADRFKKGEEANRWIAGKPLNITELVGDKIAYDPELIQMTALAGMQWLLASNQYGSELTIEDASELLGLPAGDISPTMLTDLNQGMSLVEVKRSLASKIKAYWGVNTNNAAAMGYTEGIPEAMAAELIRAFETNQLMEVIAIPFTGSDGVQKEVFRYAPVEIPADSPLRTVPNAIDTVVLTSPEETTYFGDDVPEVAPKQLRNPIVDNTPEQRAAIKNEQDTPYFINPPMVDLYKAMGEANILKLFGAGPVEGLKFNINHLRSLEGKNRTTISAYRHLVGLASEWGNRADAAGVALTDLPVHYAHNITKVGRLQMLGKHNPQSSKLVREAILPTRSTLNLSTNGRDYEAFSLGLAQALGVKVHKLSLQESITKVESLLNNDLADAVRVVSNALTTGVISDDNVDVLKKAFTDAGVDLSAVALHAVVEHARLRQMDDKSAFTTSLYVEADGVTNGPINAMVLLSSGSFTPQWVQNVAKGGLLFKDATTMNEQSKVDAKDLYQTSTDNLAVLLDDLRKEVAGNPAVNGQLNQLSTLMDQFMPDFEYKDGVLSLSRGIAKNPLTITIYGSGAAGIAGKMVSILTTAIYERLSDAAQLQDQYNVSLGTAMFGRTSDTVTEAETKFQVFMDAVEALTDNVVKRTKEGLVFSSNSKSQGIRIDPETFTFSEEALKNLEQNMLHLFVNPMREAITQTVGKPLMDSAEILRKAVQVQSIFLQYAFEREVNKALDEKAKDPNWKKTDFLSRRELDGLMDNLKSLSPLVQTGTQNYFIAGSQSTDIKVSEFGRALDDTLRTPSYVYGPMDAGVAGVPTMVIGTGDGQMMQTIATMKGAPKGTLKIFDGMNMKLSTIIEDSRKSNQAVYDSWQGNPMKAVHQSFSTFLKDADFSTITPDQSRYLAATLFGPRMADKMTMKDVRDEMMIIESRLNDAAQSIDARHRAIAQVQVHVDQMAAAASPYINKGVVLTSATPEDIAVELNKLYDIELAKIQKANDTTEELSPVMQNIGRLHKTGVRELSTTAINNLARSLNMPEGQKAVFDQIRLGLAAKEYKVVYGTADQIAAYTEATGKQALAPENNSSSVKGYTVFSDKTIYLVNPSSETLVHELIHAATYESVLAHYQGGDLGINAESIGDAVKNIEILMDQFLDLDNQVDNASIEMRQAYQDATSAINGHLSDINQPTAVRKANALNEYMAWALTNQALERLQKRNKVSSLVQMAKNVIQSIKALIWGRKKAPAVANDMFSNLLFNTSVIIRSQPSVRDVAKDTMLFQNGAYGSSDRLVEVNKAFAKRIVDLLPVDPVDRISEQAKVDVAQMTAIRINKSVQAHGFPMTMQESSTFDMIVGALATEAKIDPNALARAQELYTHVVKNLTVESFMADPTSNDPAARYNAQEKFDVVTGNYLTEVDAKGRSTLLPSFLGLAIVNDEFRSVLAQIPVPKNTLNQWNTLDGILENVGNQAMDSLSLRLSGEGKNAPNVSVAIDNLAMHISDMAQDRQAFIDQYASPVGNGVDRMNQIMVDGLEKLSDATIDRAQKIEAGTDSKVLKAVAASARMVASIATEKNGQKAAQGIMVAMNNIDGWKPLHDLVNDIMGRTETNANVYDMIKGVRSQVQQDRQQYREIVPTVIADKYSRKLTDVEWSTLYKGLGKTDIMALQSSFTNTQIMDMLQDQKKVDAQINKLEQQLQTADPQHWSLLQKKARQLAYFMEQGVPGRNLLRNAYAVANLFGEATRTNRQSPDVKYVQAVDQLVSLYTLEGLSKADRDTLSSLAQSEAEGMDFTLSYLQGQRVEEQRKANAPMAQINNYKGHIPSENQQGVSLIVADDTEHTKLTEKSYIRVATYNGSSAEPFAKQKGYYFAPVSGRAAYNQGILQNVRQTAGGVDTVTGYTHDMMTAGRITDPAAVARILARTKNETGREPMLPVYNQDGDVVAFERSVDPNQLQRIQGEQHLAKMIGQWRGRQSEEIKGQFFNERLIDKLKDMYDTDMKDSSFNKSQYVDVFDRKVLAKDPVLADAIKLMSQETQDYVKKTFGKEFYVRRDMLNDAFGYRDASIGDMWSGNSRWSKDTQDRVKRMVIGAFGNNAYKYMVNAEKTLQNYVKDARVLIVVKSVVVPFSNLMANVYQLAARGVPLANIARGMPRKTAEINSYVKSQIRKIEAEAELRAASKDVVAQRKLKAEIQTINDSHRRMSIWPLIEAGEFTSISDAGISRDEILLTEGRLNAYMEKLVDKLPGGLQTAGKYALVTKDTALFQGMQKAMEYGDFLAKAVLYDDLTIRQKKSKEYALGRVTEEFVNYDRLPGRFRGYLESMGMMWFYNFKIRSSKIAVSMIRNNPVHSLLAVLAPTPTFFGSVGLPIEDNMFSKLADGSLDYSLGLGQGLRAPMLNPWMNLAH